MSRSTDNKSEGEVLRPREYKLLNRAEVYDHAVAEELAEAMTERNMLAKRVAKLQEMIEENDELKQFIWTTVDGKAIALHKLEDDHLTNILRHLYNRGVPISKPLKAEAAKRSIEVPETSMMKFLGDGEDDVHHEDIGNVWDL